MRSFVRRDSRRLSRAQSRALQTLWPVYGVRFQPLPLDVPDLYSRRAHLHVEVGAGSGEVALQLAAQHPENDYLLLEVDRACVGRILLAAAAQDLRNLRIMDHDAAEVFQCCLPADSVDAIYIFFPDPWPKRRHRKRRLIQTDFLRCLGTCLAPSGRIFIATDCHDYAQHMVQVFGSQRLLYRLGDQSASLPRPAWRRFAKYERRAHHLGHTVFDFCLAKSPVSCARTM